MEGGGWRARVEGEGGGVRLGWQGSADIVQLLLRPRAYHPTSSGSLEPACTYMRMCMLCIVHAVHACECMVEHVHAYLHTRSTSTQLGPQPRSLGGGRRWAQMAIGERMEADGARTGNRRAGWRVWASEAGALDGRLKDLLLGGTVHLA